MTNEIIIISALVRLILVLSLVLGAFTAGFFIGRTEGRNGL